LELLLDFWASKDASRIFTKSQEGWGCGIPCFAKDAKHGAPLFVEHDGKYGRPPIVFLSFYFLFEPPTLRFLRGGI
jgi:hypothetical protein